MRKVFMNENRCLIIIGVIGGLGSGKIIVFKVIYDNLNG